jgi:hypothetical protein
LLFAEKASKKLEVINELMVLINLLKKSLKSTEGNQISSKLKYDLFLDFYLLTKIEITTDNKNKESTLFSFTQISGLG